jgi:uncharacterized protein YjiS (DUF1127 family)
MSDLMMTRPYSARPSAHEAVPRHWGMALQVALRTYVTRQALPELTERELTDIGISRDDALAEAVRLPWDTKPSRRRRGAKGIFGHLARWLERARTRRLMGRMQARELHDLGLNPSAAHGALNGRAGSEHYD